jgi:integrase
MSVMLACAAEDGDIASNPASGVRYVPSEQAKREHPKRKRHALSADDVTAVLNATPEQWRAFFLLLAQTGVRVGEALGLTWGNVHLGDDPHIMVAEQVHRGTRKKLKTDASKAPVPLSAAMASWLADLRPENAMADAPVFPSATGTPLNYHNVYNRVLRPALERSGLAIVVGRERIVGRDGEEEWSPIYDYQGIAFHAFRKACGSLLLHHGKTLKQVQGWLRHAQLTTTMNVYIEQVDDRLGGAAAWDDILPGWGHPGATGHPETAANSIPAEAEETVA